jgi:hypothetical protein
MKHTVYISILDAISKLRLTQLYFNRWIREDVIFKMIQHHNALCQLDERLLQESSFVLAFSRTSLSFVHSTDIPNHLGIFRKCERKMKHTNNDNGKKNYQNKCIYYYYFTKLINSVPPKKINWYSNAMTSFIPVRRSRRILHPLPSTPLQVTPLPACHCATRSSSTHSIDSPTTPTK